MSGKKTLEISTSEGRPEAPSQETSSEVKSQNASELEPVEGNEAGESTDATEAGSVKEGAADSGDRELDAAREQELPEQVKTDTGEELPQDGETVSNSRGKELEDPGDNTGNRETDGADSVEVFRETGDSAEKAPEVPEEQTNSYNHNEKVPEKTDNDLDADRIDPDAEDHGLNTNREYDYTDQELRQLEEEDPGYINEEVLDYDDETYKETGLHRIRWGEDSADTPHDEVLRPGTVISRVGDDRGSYFADRDIAYGDRQLPVHEGKKPIREYEVVKPLPVEQSTIAKQPWGDEMTDSEAQQYKTEKSARDLVDEGYLREIDPRDQPLELREPDADRPKDRLTEEENGPESKQLVIEPPDEPLDISKMTRKEPEQQPDPEKQMTDIERAQADLDYLRQQEAEYDKAVAQGRAKEDPAIRDEFDHIRLGAEDRLERVQAGEPYDRPPFHERLRTPEAEDKIDTIMDLANSIGDLLGLNTLPENGPAKEVVKALLPTLIEKGPDIGARLHDTYDTEGQTFMQEFDRKFPLRDQDGNPVDPAGNRFEG